MGKEGDFQEVGVLPGGGLFVRLQAARWRQKASGVDDVSTVVYDFEV
jgi:hypothetical protein